MFIVLSSSFLPLPQLSIISFRGLSSLASLWEDISYLILAQFWSFETTTLLLAKMNEEDHQSIPDLSLFPAGGKVTNVLLTWRVPFNGTSNGRGIQCGMTRAAFWCLDVLTV
jgi:hypothetical protein